MPNMTSLVFLHCFLRCENNFLIGCGHVLFNFYHSLVTRSDVFVQCLDAVLGVQTNDPSSPLLNKSLLHPPGLGFVVPLS